VLPAFLLAPQAIEFSLYEEAFEIYKKFGKKVNAIQVLLNNLQDLDRAHEYANKVSRRAEVALRQGASLAHCHA
jgi:clathrin heavy chain